MRGVVAALGNMAERKGENSVKCPHGGEYKELRGDGRHGVWCAKCHTWKRWEFPLAEFTPEMEAKVREIIRDELKKARGGK